ncbi:MAG TPA: twin-arginine translocase TatA/TatE family subunit [Gammaproteobacteria bacterium]|nr:twin-arginine translocase TatA/TatE family subunit [Gammaproteobacteria bacterium]
MELSVGKILLILIIVVLVFGTAKLPKLGEDLGKAMRSFKKGMHDSDNEPSVGTKSADDKSKTDSDNTAH